MYLIGKFLLLRRLGHFELRLRFLQGRHSRLPPVGVAVRNGYVEHPLMPLLFGFNQTHVPERKNVLLHPFDLLPAHTAALNVHGNTREMGRSRLAGFRRCVAVMAP